MYCFCVILYCSIIKPIFECYISFLLPIRPCIWLNLLWGILISLLSILRIFKFFFHKRILLGLIWMVLLLKMTSWIVLVSIVESELLWLLVLLSILGPLVKKTVVEYWIENFFEVLVHVLVVVEGLWGRLRELGIYILRFVCIEIELEHIVFLIYFPAFFFFFLNLLLFNILKILILFEKI